MITTASKALAQRAMPAALVRLSVVALLLAAPTAGHASEGNDIATVTPAVLRAAPPPVQAAADIVPARAPVPPAPAPLAAGPVWTDASGVWRQDGVASWYGGRRWQGRRTASGIRYNENHLVAAHASLPMGSQVRVTVADTGRSVIVTIVDRPGTRTRIIDLSRAAAIQLGILQRGIARVSLAPA